MTHLYAVHRRYGPAYDPAKPLEAQPDWPGHVVFMNALEADGAVLLAGPLHDAAGRSAEALLIIRGASPEAVARRLDDDPWTSNEVFESARVERWALRVGTLE